MSLLEMREMRDLRGTCQRELALNGRRGTDPMNSDMAVKEGIKTCKREGKLEKRRTKEERGGGKRWWVRGGGWLVRERGGVKSRDGRGLEDSWRTSSALSEEL
jgi:hypothetical protein